MNVLVTAIGSMASEAIISSLKSKHGIHLIGCDIYPKNWIYTSNLVDNFYQVPRADSILYIEELIRICDIESVEYLIPLTDLEIDLLSENIDVFKKKNVTICISEPNVIRVCRDKLLLYRELSKCDGISVIPTYTYEEIKDHCFPIIAKPRKGRSSEGLFVAKNRNMIDSIIEDFESYVFQPYIIGSVFTVDFVRDSNGSYFFLPRQELLRTKNGAGITVEVKENSCIENVLNCLVDCLPVKGCLNFEFIYDGKTYYLMDINPRFSAGVAFSQLVGYDFVYNHLKVFMGLSIDCSINYSSIIVCKRYREYINKY